MPSTVDSLMAKPHSDVRRCRNPRCEDDLVPEQWVPICWTCRGAVAIGLSSAAPLLAAAALLGRVVGWW